MNILRLVIIVLLFYLIFRLLRGWVLPGRPAPRPDAVNRGERPSAPGRVEDLVRDPQCGVYVPRSEGLASVVDGRVLYFCSQVCRDQYLEAHRRES